MKRLTMSRRLALGVAVALAAAGLTLQAVPSSGRYDSGGQRVLYQGVAPAAGVRLTLREAIASARAHLADPRRPVLLARNVGSDASSGTDGRDLVWTVVLASDAERREIRVRIEGGSVTLVEESASAGPHQAVDTSVDSAEAADIARASGLASGAEKAPGFAFSLRAVDGAGSLAVIGSLGGFNGKVEIDPTTAVTRSRERYVPSDKGGVLVSDDRGAHWRAADLRGSIFAVASHLTGAYAVQETADGLWLWDTTAGDAWTKVAALPLQPGARAYALLAMDSRVLLLGTSAGLFRSSDGGHAWQRDPGLTGPVQYLAQTAGGIAAATVTAGAAAGTYLLRSSDQWVRSGAAGRLAEIGGGQVAVLSEPATAATLIDGGAVSSDINVPLRTLRLARSGSALVAATPDGVLRSEDDGVTWTTTLPAPNASLLASREGVVIVGGYRSPTYMSTDSGRTWVATLPLASSLCAGTNEIIQLRDLGAGRIIAIHGGTREWRPY